MKRTNRLFGVGGDSEMSEKLTLKQKLFIEHYLKTSNGTEAARVAGYEGLPNTLAVVAHENLRKPYIRQIIDERLRSIVMESDEVLRRLSQHARASLADVLDENGFFDLDTAKRRGTDHLLKKLKIKRRIEHHEDRGDTEFLDYEFEIHDPQSALVHLGKHYGLFPTQIKVTDETADKLIDEALEKHNLPKPETFAGEPVLESEM